MYVRDPNECIQAQITVVDNRISHAQQWRNILSQTLTLTGFLLLFLDPSVHFLSQGEITKIKEEIDRGM